MLGLQLCLDYVLWVGEEPAEEAANAASDELLEERGLLVLVARDAVAHFPETVFSHLICGELSCVSRDLARNGRHQSLKEAVWHALFTNDLDKAIDRALVVSLRFRLRLQL